MTHEFACHVYYEDTDLAGIVYYANYLKYIERARTEFVRGLGLDQTALRKAQGLVFAVRRVEADYLQAARFDDELQVQTSVQSVSGARVVLAQGVARGPERLFEAVVTLVCLQENGRAARIPAEFRAKLEQILV